MIKNVYDCRIIGDVLYSDFGYRYCPKPSALDTLGFAYSYDHRVLCPDREVITAPFYTAQLAEHFVFYMWAEMGCPPASIFNENWLTNMFISHLYAIFKEYSITSGDWNTLVTMERLTKR